MATQENTMTHSTHTSTHASTPRAALGLLALSASFLLMACGSGNNTTPGVALVPGTDVPVAATQDSAAAFNFVASIVAKGEADSETPLVVGDAELAASDTADPVIII
jgi:hypothetical protein